MPGDVQDMAELQKLHADFVEAFKSNDPKQLGAFYAENAVLMPPRSNAVSGREQIATFWQNRQRIRDLKFEPTDARYLSDDVIREVGNLELTMRGQGGRATNVQSVKYVSIWHRVDGDWKLETSIWNGKAGGGGQGQGGRGQGGGGGQGGGQGARGQQGGGRRLGQGGGGQGGGGRGPGGGGQGGGGRGQRGGGQGGGGQGGGGQGRGRFGGGGGRGGQGGGGQGGGGRGGQNPPLVPQVD